MPKGKSSASSGTRKKHAKKAGKNEDDAEIPQQPAQRGQKKLTKAQKKAPKVKQYIPPPKPPAPPIPDPLDGQGLARELPADLVVVLRRLGKKDEVTRRKGLEELKDWVAGLKEGDEVEQELKETALLSAVPVWLHNLASLLQSPFHRSLALQLQSDLLAIPSTHASIVDSLSLGLLPGTQNRDVLGSWFVAALEDGRRSRVTQAWDNSTSWGPTEGRINLVEHQSALIEYLSLSILDPASLHDDIHPAPVSSAPVAPRKGKFVLPEAGTEEEPEDNELLARYRVGGLVGLTRVVQASKPTPELLALLQQPGLWSLLSEGDSDQPAVRRSAYTLLDSIIDALPEEVEKSLSLLSPAVHVCWLEKDAGVWQQAGQAVAKFLNKYRHSWSLAGASDDDDDSEDDDYPQPFIHFLGWLSTICPLIPHLTYPLLLVIVSTLPENLQSETSALESFFVHLWSPIDARLLSTHSMPNQQSAFQAFFQGAIDCTVFLVAKALRGDQHKAQWLVQEQLVKRAWEEGVLEMGGRDKKREHEAEIFGKGLARVDPSLIVPLGESLYARCFHGEDGTAILLRSIGIISVVQRWAPAASLSVEEIARRASELFSKHPSALLADALLMAFAEESGAGPRATTALSLSTQLPALLPMLPPKTIVRLFEATSSEGSVLWSVINSPNTPRETRFALVLAAIDSTLGGNLDLIALEATQSALEIDSEAGIRVACASLAIVSEDALHTILALVCTSIHDQVDDILNGAEAAVPLSAMDILAAYASKHPEALAQSDILLQALVAVHHLVFLLPRNSLETFQAPAVAQTIWKSGISSAEEMLTYKVSAALRDMLGRVSCLIEPAVLVDVALADLVQDISPATPSAPHPTLSIVDNLVPIQEINEDRFSYDSRGLSRNARYAEAALAVLRTDRKLATQRIPLLVMVLSAATAARDTLNVPHSGRGFFSPMTERHLLEDYIREADGALSFALATLDDAPTAWHQTAIGALSGKNPAEEPLQELLVALAQGDGDIPLRVLRDVLSRYLRHSGEKELELWLALGMSSKASLSIAVISAVKPHMLDSEKLHTAQNRLASGLTASPAPDLPALRRLLACSPPADAPSVFLPQQRAIFVLRHLGSWLTSDEDYDESMEVYAAQLYAALAPIVQDVSGGHWDAIFDLIESGLEASMEDVSSHCLLFSCLVLLQQVRDLAGSNKSLRALWVAKDQHLGLVLKLFLQCRQSDTVPLQLIHAAILDLLQDVSNIEGADVDELCELIHSSTSPPVQSTAYSILSKVIKARTVDLVLQAETTEASLPGKLIGILSTPTEWDEIEMSTALARLLGWMAVLDHFEDASRTLRWAYLDQINSAQLLQHSLIPMLFGILGVTEVGAWNFPSSQYGVDEFYTDLLDPEELPDLAPLASHVFYRALTTLPAAMRTYYESLKDRQLSMSMLNFTARHYSPVIIRHEFSALRQPAALALFTEEGLNVRIAQGGGATVAAGAGSAEAIASYVVDEQPMEIGIRLPAEFPLRGVEIRDLKRVGVPENKWRGWLMSVQQTITSRNGLILEALTVFKKNVSLHFEGVVECAICYSIISLTDRTLPTKPCRTCKNRFHASCLFKWFNSSHSSSCPMCRALF